MYPYSPRSLNTLYEQCLWHNGELDGQRIDVKDPTGVSHHFHALRLDNHRSRVIRFLRALSPSMMRSNGCRGVPWQLAAYIDAADFRYDEPYALKLIALGAASELVTINRIQLSSVQEVQYFVVVEDRRWRDDANTRRWLRARGRDKDKSAG